ncbi:protein of unknown function [Candidatus Promineifilum breve]|uniref:Uncharacterized protein n=1 Tax=Candidatus Promineifilum breve TaxID=1806508 RepID=A0A160T2A3_9CHLR|nr:protein of unknown function [Candidatus Promineifilum breve]
MLTHAAGRGILLASHILRNRAVGRNKAPSIDLKRIIVDPIVLPYLTDSPFFNCVCIDGRFLTREPGTPVGAGGAYIEKAKPFKPLFAIN